MELLVIKNDIELEHARGGSEMIIRCCRILFLMAIVGCLLIGPATLPSMAASNYGKLGLFEQDALGRINVAGAYGILKYNLTGPRFNFNLQASKLDKGISYSLIRSREPEVMLPARYEIFASGISDSGGNLNLSGSYKFNMDLLAAKILLIPTEQPPDKTLTYEGKYLFGDGTIKYDDTTTDLICGGNQSPGPSDLLGLQKGDKAVNFSLYGLDPSDSEYPLALANQEQKLKQFTLSELLQTKPVLLVNGAFT